MDEQEIKEGLERDLYSLEFESTQAYIKEKREKLAQEYQQKGFYDSGLHAKAIIDLELGSLKRLLDSYFDILKRVYFKNTILEEKFIKAKIEELYHGRNRASKQSLADYFSRLGMRECALDNFEWGAAEILSQIIRNIRVAASESLLSRKNEPGKQHNGTFMRMGKKRDQFLLKLNELSEGDVTRFVDTMRIGESLGFGRALAFNCAEYFVQKRYIVPREEALGTISITAAGIDEADRIQSARIIPLSSKGGLRVMSKKLFGNRWEIIRSINEGGQAFIDLVKDAKAQDNKQYVLKRLKNEKRIERFRREIEAINSIDSPYVERIIDFSIDDNDFFYVMPYYTDQTLESILKDLGGNFIRALRIFEKICEGINSAHINKTPIIHRDLKPSNILINENDVPRIIDFGLCFLEDKERITFTQEQVGSRFYIAPECAEGRTEEVGPHTDIYSLGKVLYAMISGGIIFDRERQNEDRYDLKQIVPDIRTKYITQLINKCVNENPRDRIQDIGSLLSIARESIRLLDAGFFPPNYGDDFCRFCGKGKLVKFGKLKGSIFTPANSPGLTEDIGRHGMFLWGCEVCGVAFLFKDDLYKKS